MVAESSGPWATSTLRQPRPAGEYIGSVYDDETVHPFRSDIGPPAGGGAPG